MNTDTIVRSGHTAIITGASLGIGRAMAIKLASIGMNVCLADLPGPDLNAALASVCAASPDGASKVLAIPTDVADQNQLDSLAQIVIQRYGAPHLLMNNAVTRVGKGIDAALSEWRQAIDVNVLV